MQFAWSNIAMNIIIYTSFTGSTIVVRDRRKRVRKLYLQSLSENGVYLCANFRECTRLFEACKKGKVKTVLEQLNKKPQVPTSRLNTDG